MELTQNEAATKRTYNTIAARYALSRNTKNYWQPELEVFNELLPTGHVLEIGAGGGRDAQELIAAGYEYTGVDISQPMLEQAQKKNPGGRFIVQNMYDLTFEHSFDGFWCAATLLHLPKSRLPLALRKIHHAIRSGGIGLITIKEGSGESMKNYRDTNLQRLFSYYQRDEFQKILKDNNYEVLRVDARQADQEERAWLSYHVRITTGA